MIDIEDERVINMRFCDIYLQRKSFQIAEKHGDSDISFISDEDDDDSSADDK